MIDAVITAAMAWLCFVVFCALLVYAWRTRHYADDPGPVADVRAVDCGQLLDDDAVADDADRLFLLDLARSRQDAELAGLAAAQAVPDAWESGTAFREMLVLWPTWHQIVEYVSHDDPRHADPQSIFGAACASDQDRLAALLFAHQIGDTLFEAHELLDEVLGMAREGRRPRYGRELGLTADMFEFPVDGEAA